VNTIQIILAGNKKVNAIVRDFTISTDQPVSSFGENTAPTPFELFLASLGTCAGFFIASFCESRKIPSDGIKILQKMERNNETHMVEKILLEIYLPKDFPDKYKNAVIKAAESCIVKKHLLSPPQIEITAEKRD
jgi:ribosomal protein S12 methylthiotransferase accessory factor